MSPDLQSEVTDDAVLGGRLRLLQPRRGHRFGHDAILLAAATPAEPGERAVDLGAGVGAAGLALAARVADVAVSLVEIDAALAALAAENARRNGFAGRVSVATLDVAAPERDFARAGLAAGSADHVLMNPPFRDAAQGTPSPDPSRRLAHVGGDAALPVWVGAAARLLHGDGTLTLIHRADALAHVLAALEPAFGAVDIQPIHPKPDAAAIRIVVRAVRGSRAPLTLRSGLVLNDAGGRPSMAAEAVLRAAMPLA